MHRKALLAALVLPVALALAGCSSGGGPLSTSAPEGSAPAGGGAGGGSSAGCIVGTWSADMDDLANQLKAQYDAKSLPVDSVDGTGSETATFGADGSAVWHSDYTIKVGMKVGGVPMEVDVRHAGDITSHYAYDGATLTFSDYDASADKLTTKVLVNGQAVSNSNMDVPLDNSQGAVPTSVACDGNTLSIQANITAASPFVIHWARQ